MDPNIKSFKTTLCRHYMNKGHCSLANNCYFAHGEEELRKRVDPIPNFIPPSMKPVSIYKTQLCKYFMNGYCRNFQSCPFAHGEKDLHGMVVVSSSLMKPDFGQAGQFLFKQVFPEDAERMAKVKRGQEKGNALITEIMGDSTLSQKQRQQCQTILENAFSLHNINYSPY